MPSSTSLPAPTAGPRAVSPVHAPNSCRRHAVVQPLAADAREHERVAAAVERPRRVEVVQRTPAQRDPVLALHLHPGGRDGPTRGPPCPSRPQPPRNLAGPRRTERRSRRGIRTPASSRSTPATTGPARLVPATSRCGNVRMCCTKSPCGPSAGAMRSTWVVVPVACHHGPFHDRADALANPPRCRRPRARPAVASRRVRRW